MVPQKQGEVATTLFPKNVPTDAILPILKLTVKCPEEDRLDTAILCYTMEKGTVCSLGMKLSQSERDGCSSRGRLRRCNRSPGGAGSFLCPCEEDSPVFAAETENYWKKHPLCREEWGSPP